ncbi:hypothetical protein [Streptomyces griseosporeus]|uniref:hypothetical protein n=1 Tax=Streptomyces griseosporeus TaxID=1910 RepID=UPI0036FFBFFA
MVVMRAAALLGLLTTLALAAVAGLFTTGDVGMLDWHSTLATLLAVLVLVQLVDSVLLWRGNRRLRAPIAGSVLVVLMVVVQIMLGDSRVLAGHMPLGMAICAAQAVLAYWSFGLRPAGRAQRTEAVAGEAA